MRNTSDHFDGKVFTNPVPTEVTPKGGFVKMIREAFKKHPGRKPVPAIGPFTTDTSIFRKAPESGLRVTWLGHATLLLEIDGLTLLTDPVWYHRASPFSAIGPKRYFDVPIPLKDLPRPDLILLSHDHYDHLDKQTMLFFAAQKVPVLTMLGVGKRLVHWGVPRDLVTEMDWWQEIEKEGLRITACPARHFSGRWINDRFTTLWGAFSIKGNRNSVFYGADSGYFRGFLEIGERLGPFDLTLLEIGAYNYLWPDIHMGPENAVRAHRDLKGKILLPIHWGTFSLAFHPWTEPVERLMKAAELSGVALLLPAPGQPCEPGKTLIRDNWWDHKNV